MSCGASLGQVNTPSATGTCSVTRPSSHVVSAGDEVDGARRTDHLRQPVGTARRSPMWRCPADRAFDHHVVRMPAAAAGTVVADPHGGVLLLWRHRFTTDSWGWEVPAGRIDEGETPEQAAAREVLEETGWQPGPLRHLVTYHPHNGSSRRHVPPVRRHRRHPRRRAIGSERSRACGVDARRSGALARGRRRSARRPVTDRDLWWISMCSVEA
jgi:8-oxo-dGTP pyrophosphatase MutT (NUDIX family)